MRKHCAYAHVSAERGVGADRRPPHFGGRKLHPRGDTSPYQKFLLFYMQ
jgi:hypothetical protein